MHKARYAYQHSGFTLIELSIVLVIIGLIAGGVLVGRDMIHAAELRKVGTTIEQYRTATTTFASKYDALPGDFSDATRIWGTSPDGCPAAWGATGPYIKETCNGNGDGTVGPKVAWVDSGGIVLPGARLDEWARYWHHLSNAGLISGTYWSRDGVFQDLAWDPANTHFAPSLSVPRGGSAYILLVTGIQYPAYLALGFYLEGPQLTADHYFVLGGMESYWLALPRLSPNDARWVDGKFDDGLPWSGQITSMHTYWFTPCADPAANNYINSDRVDLVISGSMNGCTLVFDAGF